MSSQEQEMLKKLLQNITGGDNALMALFAATMGGGQGRDGKVYQPGVDRTGDKIVIPEGANLPDVIDALKRQHSREEQYTAIHVTLPVSPWDGALALVKAIEEQLGVVIQQDKRGGADQIDIEVELGKTVSVPWGAFELPGMEGAEISTDTGYEEGRIVFKCHVECKRRYEPRVRRLLDMVRDIASKNSLHKGKAFSIAFYDDEGDQISMPKPKFFKLSNEEPIYRTDLTSAIERNVFVPIQHSDSLEAMGESLKRGVLFAGDYGVGKTLLASHIARVATAAGWTFIYVKDSTELPEALRYAQQYQPVVVFAEDIDRVAGLERTDEVNELLNQLDGIDGKGTKIMTILTSNHPDQVNAAMRRPGRIDMVLEVLPPDEEAVKRMIDKFADGTIDSNADLTGVSTILAGESPARIRESIGRAKLESLRRTGSPTAKISSSDLEAVALEVKAEGNLFQRNELHPATTAQNMGALAEGFTQAGHAMKKALNGSGKPVYTQ